MGEAKRRGTYETRLRLASSPSGKAKKWLVLDGEKMNDPIQLFLTFIVIFLCTAVVFCGAAWIADAAIWHAIVWASVLALPLTLIRAIYLAHHGRIEI